MGPGVDSVGFWRGASDADICARLTHTDSSLWIENQAECAAIILKDFESWVTLINTVVYVFVVLRCITACGVVVQMYVNHKLRGSHRVISMR